jgi:hypothetical protein
MCARLSDAERGELLSADAVLGSTKPCNWLTGG